MNSHIPPGIQGSLLRENGAEKVDVAINVFAKPMQLSLSILSLLQHSGASIGKIWLQYEPMGSKFDSISPYCIAKYLQEVLEFPVEIFQPEIWLARGIPDADMLADTNSRLAIRYQYAFENSQSRLLFLTHNDVFILQDIIRPLAEGIGDCFAIGSLGQCWNCPAANADIMADVMGAPPCTPDTYENARPDHGQLLALYQKAAEKGVFARAYDADGFGGEFSRQPWPLPECRINEWAFMLNLEKTRPHSAPFGPALPPGAFGRCASENLDIGVPWFRAMHDLGMRAKNFPIDKYLRHWVGTGNKSAIRYAIGEDNALRLLTRHYPEYIAWLEKDTGRQWRPK